MAMHSRVAFISTANDSKLGDAWLATAVQMSLIGPVLAGYAIFALPKLLRFWSGCLPWLLFVAAVALLQQWRLGLFRSRPPAQEDAGLTEGWYWGVPPLLLWFALAVVALPVYGIPCLCINLVSGVSMRLPVVGPWLACWREVGEEEKARAVDLMLAACDREAVDLQNCPKKVRAVTMQGAGYNSFRFFGHAYYLVKHDLVDDDTHIYGYSMATGIVACLALAASRKSADERLQMLRRGMGAYVSFRLELAANALWGCTGVIRLTRTMIAKMEFALPDDVAHVSGKLHIYVTRILDPKPLSVVSRFDTKEHVLQTMAVSCYWPWTWNMLPLVRFQGAWCADGGFALHYPVPSEHADTTPCMVCTTESTESEEVQSVAATLRTCVFQFPGCSENDVMREIVAGYRQAHRLHKGMLEKRESIVSDGRVVGG